MKLSRSALLGLLAGLFATLALLLGAARYRLDLSRPLRPLVSMNILCPQELRDQYGLTAGSLPGTVAAINRHARHLAEANLQIDAYQPVERIRSATPPRQALFCVDLTTGDGSRLVSRNHPTPFEKLDQAMADCVDQGVQDYLELRARLGDRSGPVVLRNF
ncbi:MAG: hypothetical protein AB7D57_06160 [Desulfovibrionaceae bacterium]